MLEMEGSVCLYGPDEGAGGKMLNSPLPVTDRVQFGGADRQADILKEPGLLILQSTLCECQIQILRQSTQARKLSSSEKPWCLMFISCKMSINEDLDVLVPTLYFHRMLQNFSSKM